MTGKILLRKILLATLVLGSLSVVLPLVLAVVALVHGAAIPAVRWGVPLILLATGGSLFAMGRRWLPVQALTFGVVVWAVALVIYWMRALG